MQDRVTVRAIAKESGFSIGTVDRALNNRGRISDKTKQKILEIAVQLGYKPNKLASALSKNQMIKLAAVFPIEPGYYFQTIKDGMIDAQNELSACHIKIDFYHTESLDPAKQIEKLANIKKEELDGLVVSPGNSTLDFLINSFVDSGIPTITFANDSPTSKRLFYIGQNTYLAGKLGGELIGKLLHGSGNVLTLIAFSNVYSLEERYAGFEDALKKEYPQIKIIGPYEYYDKDRTAYDIVSNMIKREKIDGVFVASASGTVGSAKALANNASKERPILVGYDDVQFIKKMIKAGIIDATITQDPYLQGYYSIKLITKNILEGWVPEEKRLYTPLKILMKYNMDDSGINKNMVIN